MDEERIEWLAKEAFVLNTDIYERMHPLLHVDQGLVAALAENDHWETATEECREHWRAFVRGFATLFGLVSI